jgi:hypothetical protein
MEKNVHNWSPTIGDHVIDILTFGDDYWHHAMSINGKLESVICRNKTFGNYCPFCNLRESMDEHIFTNNLYHDSPNAYRDLLSRKRGVYNIICYDSKEEQEKGVQTWDVSNYMFEHQLLQSLNTSIIGSIFLMECITNPITGKSVSFTKENTNLGFIKIPKYTNFELLERNYTIPETIRNKTHNLATPEPSYDEVEKKFKQWLEENNSSLKLGEENDRRKRR